MRLAVHVTPRSGRDEVVGWHGGELSLRVTAPPEDGKANAAACALLAKSLGVPKGSVRVVRGESARHKQVEVDDIEQADVDRAFGEMPSGLF